MPGPTVFVASSSEGLRLAQAIQQNLKGHEVKLWNVAFSPGNNVIDELTRNLLRSDFGVFVFSPDDTAVIRGKRLLTARDNVVFELGMFMGLLGKERSFIVQPEGQKMRLPTDLLGLITAQYDAEWAKREPVFALGPACAEIEDAIKRQHRRKTRELSQMITDSLETICWSMSAPVTPERASLRAFLFRKEGDELVCRGYWDPYRSVEQVGKTKFRIDKKTAESVIVVRTFLENQTGRTCEVSGSSVKPLPADMSGVKGKIKPGLTYVLAAPIRSENDSVWGVVDFDASNNIGKRLLQNERTSNAVIERLARDLSRILTH
jgi:hypothetical protein